MPLRPFQAEALEQLKKNHTAGLRRNLIVLPTGAGKTVVMAHVPKTIGEPGKWLLLVHRKELAEQGAAKMAAWNPSLKVGIEMGVQCADYAADDVIVASVQTLREGGQRLLQMNPDDFAGIMVDEFHHFCLDNSYYKVLRHFGVDKPGARIHLLGVTATDKRGDGKKLSDILDTVAYKMSMFDGVQQGWLVPPRGYKVSTHISLDGIKTVAGDFDQKQLEKTVNTPERNRMLVEAWLERAENRQTIAFTVDIQHAKDLAETFRSLGVKAEAVWGIDPTRAEKLRAHRACETQVLCNAAVLTEGYDDWQVSCVIQGKPTRSSLQYMQQIGRATRIPACVDNLVEALKKNQDVPKVDMIVIDAVDNCSKHSLMTLASIAGLNPGLDLRGQGVFAVKKRLDELQEENPNLRVEGLLDANKIDKIIEEVDLWKVHYPEEILKETPNKWHKTLDGQYILAVAAGEGARIWGDMLDKWSCHFKVGDNEFNESKFGSRKEAFQYADRMLRLVDSKRSIFQNRNNFGDHKPASAAQLNALDKLRINHPPILTAAEASRMITQFGARHFTLKPQPTA